MKEAAARSPDSTPPPVSWTITGSAVAGMIEHARLEQPRECCGLLIGMRGRVLSACRAGNLSADPNRFLIDPKAHLDARREARTQGLEIVGFYHSHPHSAPIPSPTDLAEAWYPDHLYAIVGVEGHALYMRAYELRDGTFVELTVTTVG